MNRQWTLAVGAGALLSGIALYVITLVAVPTTTVLGTEVPVACVYGSASQTCADASARLAVMKQIQPISWFVVAIGVVVMAYGALQKSSQSDQRETVYESDRRGLPGDQRNAEGMARIKQVKQVEMAICGNCNASVREDALRCPSCGAEFTDGS